MSDAGTATTACLISGSTSATPTSAGCPRCAEDDRAGDDRSGVCGPTAAAGDRPRSRAGLRDEASRARRGELRGELLVVLVGGPPRCPASAVRPRTGDDDAGADASHAPGPTRRERTLLRTRAVSSS